MAACVGVGSLASCSSAFSTGGSLGLEKLQVVDSNHGNGPSRVQTSRVQVPVCTLEINSLKAKAQKQVLEQPEALMSIPVSLTTKAIQTVQTVLADNDGELGALARSVTQESRVLRPTVVKRSNRLKRFQSALARLRSSRSSIAAVANMAESVLTLMEPVTLPRASDSNIQLVDNFAPVLEECPPTSGLEVTGTIPECMNGIYLRNGSNPQFLPTGGYHWFDGDGMLHAVRIKDGVPSYCCRFTQTYRFGKERALGQSVFPHVMGELNGWLGMARLGLFQMRKSLGLVDGTKGIGTANAALAYFNGNLLALSEDDWPYGIAVDPETGDLRTLGRLKINGHDLDTLAMTAHPRIDPFTGEMFSYSYNVMTAPYVHYWRTSADGQMQKPIAIDGIAEPVLLHDFGITKNFAVVPDPIMVFRMKELFLGRTAVVFDEEKVFRFGVLPKYATDSSAMKWFDVPGFSAMHYINAWEDGNEVVIVSSNNSPVANTLANPSALRCSVTEIRLNMETGLASRRKVSDMNLDIGRINENFTGRKTRYTYMTMSGPWPKFKGVVKIDLEAGPGAPAEAGIQIFSKGTFVSEPFFVPRTPASSAQGPDGELDPASEDDGYVVTYIHNEITKISEMVILDARSPTLEPVARIRLPRRVPYGFHGTFLTEEQIRNQVVDPADFEERATV